MSQSNPAKSNPSQPSEEEETSTPEQAPRSTAEWVSLGISSILLTGVIGLVIYTWTASEHQQPPEVSVVSSPEVREAGGQFYVPFTVTNEGGGTAESVQIIAELSIDGEVEETGEQQIDFLSGGETEEGAFIFTRDPQAGDLVVRVASYKLP
jgi:uncharacterized protein (TIGR02588 family)